MEARTCTCILKRPHTSPDTRVRDARGERERATLRAGLCNEETGRISCSAKRETLPEGLPPIDPVLLPPFSLLDRSLYRSSVGSLTLPFPPSLCAYIHIVKRRKK